MGERTNMKKMIWIILLIVISMSFIQIVHAQDPARKLARGIANILTGWIELPKNIYDTTVEENVLVGVTLGTVKGVGMATIRTSAGVYEIITFPFPVPDYYTPVLEPEFVFSN